ncbi:MAG: hypothetical protein ACLP8A_03095, partial [Methylovirgula sp.]
MPQRNAHETHADIRPGGARAVSLARRRKFCAMAANVIYVTFSQFVGRNLTVSLNSFYVSTPDDRTVYESVSSQ